MDIPLIQLVEKRAHHSLSPSLNVVELVSCLFSNSEAKLKISPGEGEDCSGRSVIGSSSIFQFLRRGEAGGGAKTPGPRNECNTERGE